MSENIRVIPIPGPSALVAALSASGLLTNEFTFGKKNLTSPMNSIFDILCHLLTFIYFLHPIISSSVGFLSKHANSRVKRLTISASESTAQIFFVPPHKLCQFLEEASPLFGDNR